MLVFDEHIRTGPGSGITLIGLLLLLGIAVIELSRTLDDDDDDPPQPIGPAEERAP